MPTEVSSEPKELTELLVNKVLVTKDHSRSTIKTDQIPSTSSMNSSESTFMSDKDLDQVICFILTLVISLA